MQSGLTLTAASATGKVGNCLPSRGRLDEPDGRSQGKREGLAGWRVSIAIAALHLDHILHDLRRALCAWPMACRYCLPTSNGTTPRHSPSLHPPSVQTKRVLDVDKPRSPRMIHDRCAPSSSLPYSTHIVNTLYFSLGLAAVACLNADFCMGASGHAHTPRYGMQSCSRSWHRFTCTDRNHDPVGLLIV